MFTNKYCDIKKDAQWRTEKCESNFFKLVDNEQNQVDLLQEQEKLATAENPHNIFQKDRTDICKELRDCKRNNILQQKQRQQLRTNSQELRQLERQLQTALVSKQLREQQQFLAQQKVEDLRKRREENAKFAAECERIRKSMLQQEEQEKRKKEDFRDILKTQISELQDKRRSEFETVVKERDEMGKIFKQIQIDESAERREADLLRKRLKQEMEESYRNRELNRQLEKSRNNDNIERNLDYQKDCDNLKLEMVAEKKRIQKEKEAISERIGQQLATFNQEKEKRDKLLLSLLVEERKAKEDERYREKIVKQIKERQKLRNELDKYRNEIQIQKDNQLKEEEKQFHEDQMRFLAERDKLDQLSNEKQRRKKLEHSKALREMIDIRRCQKANEIAKRISDFENMKSFEKERAKLIEEERIRIISEVPKELLDYLPPGVLRSSDKEFLTRQKT